MTSRVICGIIYKRRGRLDLITNEFIQDQMPLALKIARKYMRMFPHKRFELESVAYEALVRASRIIPDEGLNTIGYISKTITRSCLRFCRTDGVIFVPDSIRGRKEDLTKLFPVSLTTFQKVVKKERDIVFRQIITHRVFSKMEHIILKMSYEGYDQSEICDKIGITRKMLWARVKNLRSRLMYILYKEGLE